MTLTQMTATELLDGLEQGRALPLDGIPLALKDNINTCDMPTTSSIGADERLLALCRTLDPLLPPTPAPVC